MTARVNRPHRKPGPKPGPYPAAKTMRIPGELVTVVHELKKLIRTQREARQCTLTKNA